MRIRVPQSSLNDQQLAGLHVRFVVPIAVQMILNDREQLDDACEAALHECLSELHPDTGLLCLALCAQQVAATAPESPAINMLAISAARMTDEYGAALLAEAGHPTLEQGPLSDEDAIMMLYHVPEDLEELASLLDAAHETLDPHDPAALLCDILSVQALVHAERAGHQLAQLSFRHLKDPLTGPSLNITQNMGLEFRLHGSQPPAPQKRKLEYIDKNVIAFPSAAREI